MAVTATGGRRLLQRRFPLLPRRQLQPRPCMWAMPNEAQRVCAAELRQTQVQMQQQQQQLACRILLLRLLSHYQHHQHQHQHRQHQHRHQQQDGVQLGKLHHQRQAAGPTRTAYSASARPGWAGYQ